MPSKSQLNFKLHPGANKYISVRYATKTIILLSSIIAFLMFFRILNYLSKKLQYEGPQKSVSFSLGLKNVGEERKIKLSEDQKRDIIEELLYIDPEKIR